MSYPLNESVTMNTQEENRTMKDINGKGIIIWYESVTMNTQEENRTMKDINGKELLYDV